MKIGELGSHRMNLDLPKARKREGNHKLGGIINERMNKTRIHYRIFRSIAYDRYVVVIVVIDEFS